MRPGGHRRDEAWRVGDCGPAHRACMHRHALSHRPGGNRSATGHPGGAVCGPNRTVTSARRVRVGSGYRESEASGHGGVDQRGLPDHGRRRRRDGVRRLGAERDRGDVGDRRSPGSARGALERRLPLRPPAPAGHLLRGEFRSARLGHHRSDGPERRLPRARLRQRGGEPLRPGHAATLPALGSCPVLPDERGRR